VNGEREKGEKEAREAPQERAGRSAAAAAGGRASRQEERRREEGSGHAP
jgi:hypothetical protein